MSEAENSLPLLLEPDELHQALCSKEYEHILLVDLASQERFLQAHLPNARHVLPSETQAGPPIPGLSPSDTQLTQLFQRIGLTEQSHVVVYDDEGGGWAGRFIWLLDEIGHKNYSYLNGGLPAWSASKRPLESGLASHPASNIIVKNHAKNTITADQLIAALNTHSLQIWDARSPKEYSGETINAAKGGHIPGAINYEWTQAMDQERSLRLKPLRQIMEELQALGMSASKDTVTHCQSHHRSGLTYLLAKLLNFKSIKAFAGSWSEWGNRADTPVER